MRLLLVALNSQYIHTNLAIRYLKAAVNEVTNVDLLELTVNDNMDYILRKIYSKSPDLIGFSCYIWNIKMVLDIIHDVKKILPGVKLILGGPEVSYDPDSYIKEGVDFVIRGEGEVALKKLIGALQRIESFDNVPGLSFKNNGEIIKNPQGPYISPDEIPFPYDAVDVENNRQRILYYEASRGCPYRCTYCLSSIENRTRFWDIERIDREISWMYENGVRFIKFVDRTFNCNKKRTMEIFNLLSKYKGMRFHMEMVSDLIDEEMLNVLKKLDPQMFQFEIGVQSLNTETLKAINRIDNYKHLSWVMDSLNRLGIKTHLDLIAGLPYENYDSMIESFNGVYNLKPSEIQVGFLKMLKGTRIRDEASKYGIRFMDSPPYEILKSDFIDYDELIILKDISFLVDKYYNSHCFDFTMRYLMTFYNNPYDLYFVLRDYWKENGLFDNRHSRDELYKILLQFVKTKLPHVYKVFMELLRFDFLLNNGRRTLECFGERNNFLHIKSDGSVFASKFEIDVSEMVEKESVYVFYRNGENKYYKKVVEEEINGQRFDMAKIKF